MKRETDFWSRRKASVATEVEVEEAALQAEVLQQDQAKLEDMSDAEILDHFDLPDPDTMEMGSDFSAFMNKAVPDRIRRRALRTLWRSNPVLANVDMLVDYGEDFTDKATVIENMQTAYQIGKGMLKHVEEMARQAEELENPNEAEAESELAEDNDDNQFEEGVAVSDEKGEDSTPYVEDLETAEDDFDMVSSPRRMKFRVEETT